MVNLTNEEKSAVASLKRLAQKWPDSLWLFSANGSLHVMKLNPDGSRRVHANIAGDDRAGGMDQDAVIATIDIPNDGGDW